MPEDTPRHGMGGCTSRTGPYDQRFGGQLTMKHAVFEEMYAGRLTDCGPN